MNSYKEQSYTNEWEVKQGTIIYIKHVFTSVIAGLHKKLRRINYNFPIIQ